MSDHDRGYNAFRELFKGLQISIAEEESQGVSKTANIISVGLFALGLLCNILTLIVLKSRNSLGSRLLLYLTYVDVTVILLLFLLTVLPEMTSSYGNIGIAFRCLVPFFYPLFRTVLTSEVYLTVLVDVQRVMILAVPLRFIHFIRDALFNKVLIGIGLFAVLYNIPEWFRTKAELYWNDELKTTLIRRSNETFTGEIYISVRMIVDNLFPIVVILISNSILIVSEIRSSLHPGQERRRRARRQLTNIVIAITTSSICIQLIASCLYVAARFAVYETRKLYYIWHSLVILIFLNSSINFTYYCLFGPKFRKTLMSVLGRKPQKKSRGYSGTISRSSLVSR